VGAGKGAAAGAIIGGTKSDESSAAKGATTGAAVGVVTGLAAASVRWARLLCMFKSTGFVPMHTWSSWKHYPDAESGDNLEAPISAGVYEVRNALTGREVAFGATDNVADALSRLKGIGGFRSRFLRMILGQPPIPPVSDLEYRTLATANRVEAETAAHYFLGLRHSAWQTRMPS
jgi:hypothetical protein